MSCISSGAGWRDCTPRPSGPMEPAIKTSRAADMRARLNISLVDAENRFRLGRIQFVKAALRTHGFMEHRSHRAISNENRVLQPLVKILDFHSRLGFIIKVSKIQAVRAHAWRARNRASPANLKSWHQARHRATSWTWEAAPSL